MCYENNENLELTDYKRRHENDNTGSQVEVTRYKDGTSTYHFGGPVGIVHYDENGEEC